MLVLEDNTESGLKLDSARTVTLKVVTDKLYIVLICRPITGPGSPVTELSVLVTMEP